LLKKRKRLDIEVCLNNVSRTKARIVAVPVSQGVMDKKNGILRVFCSCGQKEWCLF